MVTMVISDGHDKNGGVAGAKPKPGTGPARGPLRQEGGFLISASTRT